MGKRLFLLIIVLAVVLVFFNSFFSNNEKKTLQVPGIKTNTPTPVILPTTEKSTTIFVPYWTVSGETKTNKQYDRSVYFGLSVNKNGVNKQDVGFANIDNYNELFPYGEKLLALRMTDSDVNLDILSSKDSQAKIIDDAIEIVGQKGFSGLVLDLELFSLFDDKIQGEINIFVSDFYRASKANNLSFGITMYGDAFYRKRPFDIATLSRHIDEMMIMAYDFSKSYGEPGPNFPLKGQELYGYDMQTMINDFAQVVPREKLTVIFGLYGYDWTVDEKERPIKQAQALSFNEIEKKYLENCSNCLTVRDKLSQETKIVAGDHIIWFEDLTSAQTKQEFLESQGIGNFAYWAHGYF